MFSRLLKRNFWVFYDNLFKGILTNLVIFVFLFAAFVVLFMKMKLYTEALVVCVFLWHVLAPAAMQYWGKVIRLEEKQGLFKELLSGIKNFSLKGAAAFSINTAVFWIAYTAVLFYKDMIASHKIPAIILGGLGLWVMIVFLLMQLYVLPIMALDEKRRVLISYKKAALMVMTAPFSSIFTVVIFAYLLLFGYVGLGFVYGSQIPTIYALISLFPLFLLPFLSLTYIMISQLNAAILSYEKHNVMPDLKETWENRKLMHIFKPWDHEK